MNPVNTTTFAEALIVISNNLKRDNEVVYDIEETKSGFKVETHSQVAEWARRIFSLGLYCIWRYCHTASLLKKLDITPLCEEGKNDVALRCKSGFEHFLAYSCYSSDSKEVVDVLRKLDFNWVLDPMAKKEKNKKLTKINADVMKGFTLLNGIKRQAPGESSLVGNKAEIFRGKLDEIHKAVIEAQKKISVLDQIQRNDDRRDFTADLATSVNAINKELDVTIDAQAKTVHHVIEEIKTFVARLDLPKRINDLNEKIKTLGEDINKSYQAASSEEELEKLDVFTERLRRIRVKQQKTSEFTREYGSVKEDTMQKLTNAVDSLRADFERGLFNQE